MAKKISLEEYKKLKPEKRNKLLLPLEILMVLLMLIKVMVQLMHYVPIGGMIMPLIKVLIQRLDLEKEENKNVNYLFMDIKR